MMHVMLHGMFALKLMWPHKIAVTGMPSRAHTVGPREPRSLAAVDRYCVGRRDWAPAVNRANLTKKGGIDASVERMQ